MVKLEELLIEERKEEEEKRDEKRRKLVKDIHELTGYEFKDPLLLEQAFTHHTYDKEVRKFIKRSEFLGDAFLSLMFAKEHFSSFPAMDQGDLTLLRSANVNTEKLAKASLKHEIYKFLRHNIYQLGTKIEGFREALNEYPEHSSGLVDAPKVLADILESLIGAIFNDSNYCMHTTWTASKKLLHPIITPETLPMHPVTQLLEMCGKLKLKVEDKDTWDKNKEFEYVVDGKFSGKAKYGAKKIAKSRAAFIVYNKIQQGINT